MNILRTRCFTAESVLVPEMQLELGTPTCVVWPSKLTPETMNEIFSSLSNQYLSVSIALVTWLLRRSKFMFFENTVGQLIDKGKIKNELVTEALKGSYDYKPSLLGANGKILVNLGMIPEDTGLVLYTIAGLDPVGCELLINLGRLMSKTRFVIHVEFPPCQPASFPDWQVVYPSVLT